jgi:hypothetical protein
MWNTTMKKGTRGPNMYTSDFQRLLIASLAIAIGCLLPLGGVARAQVQAPPGTSPPRESLILQAPAGGRSIPLGGSHVVCAAAVDLHGWTVERDGRAVRPPATGAPGVVVTLPLAPDPTQCAAPVGTAELSLLGSAPSYDAASVTIDVDAGQVTLQGKGLRGAVLQWQSGDRSGSDLCSEPQNTAGVDTCTFAVARGLPADPTQLALSLLPVGSRTTGEVYSYDAFGLLVRPDARALRPARVVVSQLIKPGATLDPQAGSARLLLSHPEAVASLDCQDAFCVLDGNDVLIRGEHGSNDALEIQFHLRPHVVLRRTTGLDPAPSIDLPLQRCPVSAVGPPLLRGIPDQALVLKLGGRCIDDNSLQFFAAEGRLSPERHEQVGNDRYVVLRLDRTSAEEIAVTLRRGGSTVGVVSARTRRVPPLKSMLRLRSGASIEFIPTNREAELVVAAPEGGGKVVPLPVDNAYGVRVENGQYLVRGVEDGTGTVALRYAYHDPSLPAPLQDLTLATLNGPVQLPLRVANLPIALETDAKSDNPLIELLCEDGHGPDHLHRLRPGTTEQMNYRLRGTCRLVLHRERLRAEDGTQALHVTVEITAADGSPRSDAKVDQRIVLTPSSDKKPRTLFISGIEAPFDRLVVRVDIISDDLHYATPPDDKLGAQLQWSAVIGTGHFRLYATTAIPTGLYRVADEGHQGILTLNAGAILRLVVLSKEGKESPLGLEGGVMWLGITGDTSKESSAHGEFAIVTGLGLGIPIANQSRAAQTSINLHAWFEYEVSRAARPDSGIPYGFVFGPSITVGDLGVNF